MAAELIFAPAVESDLTEAYGWYESRRFGPGEEFMSHVDACIQSILRNPELHPVVYEKYRRKLVRRFPYAIFYEFPNGSVTVYCVFHTSTDPQRWRERLL
jgi:plasmid stabilization system protein ParE